MIFGNDKKIKDVEKKLVDLTHILNAMYDPHKLEAEIRSLQTNFEKAVKEIQILIAKVDPVWANKEHYEDMIVAYSAMIGKFNAVQTDLVTRGKVQDGATVGSGKVDFTSTRNMLLDADTLLTGKELNLDISGKEGAILKERWHRVMALASVGIIALGIGAGVHVPGMLGLKQSNAQLKNENEQLLQNAVPNSEYQLLLIRYNQLEAVKKNLEAQLLIAERDAAYYKDLYENAPTDDPNKKDYYNEWKQAEADAKKWQEAYNQSEEEKKDMISKADYDSVMTLYKAEQEKSEKLLNENKTLLANNQELLAMNDSLSLRIQELNKQISTLISERDNALKAQKAAEDALKQLQASTNADKEKIKQLEAEVAKQKAIVAERDKTIKSQTEELSVVNNMVQSLTLLNKQLTSENTQVKNENEMLRENEAILDYLYIEIVQKNPTGLTAEQKYAGIIAYWDRLDNAEINQYVYNLLVGTYGEKEVKSWSDEVYNKKFIEMCKAAGLLITQPGDAPSNENVYEGQPGGQSGTGSTSSGSDIAGEFDGTLYEP